MDRGAEGDFANGVDAIGAGQMHDPGGTTDASIAAPDCRGGSDEPAGLEADEDDGSATGAQSRDPLSVLSELEALDWPSW